MPKPRLKEWSEYSKIEDNIRDAIKNQDFQKAIDMLESELLYYPEGLSGYWIHIERCSEMLSKYSFTHWLKDAVVTFYIKFFLPHAIKYNKKYVDYFDRELRSRDTNERRVLLSNIRLQFCYPLSFLSLSCDCNDVEVYKAAKYLLSDSTDSVVSFSKSSSYIMCITKENDRERNCSLIEKIAKKFMSEKYYFAVMSLIMNKHTLDNDSNKSIIMRKKIISTLVIVPLYNDFSDVKDLKNKNLKNKNPKNIKNLKIILSECYGVFDFSDITFPNVFEIFKYDDVRYDRYNDALGKYYTELISSAISADIKILRYILDHGMVNFINDRVLFPFFDDLIDNMDKMRLFLDYGFKSLYGKEVLHDTKNRLELRVTDPLCFSHARKGCSSIELMREYVYYHRNDDGDHYLLFAMEYLKRKDIASLFLQYGFKYNTENISWLDREREKAIKADADEKIKENKVKIAVTFTLCLLKYEKTSKMNLNSIVRKIMEYRGGYFCQTKWPTYCFFPHDKRVLQLRKDGWDEKGVQRLLKEGDKMREEFDKMFDKDNTAPLLSVDDVEEIIRKEEEEKEKIAMEKEKTIFGEEKMIVEKEEKMIVEREEMIVEKGGVVEKKKSMATEEKKLDLKRKAGEDSVLDANIVKKVKVAEVEDLDKNECAIMEMKDKSEVKVRCDIGNDRVIKEEKVANEKEMNECEDIKMNAVNAEIMHTEKGENSKEDSTKIVIDILVDILQNRRTELQNHKTDGVYKQKTFAMYGIVYDDPVINAKYGMKIGSGISSEDSNESGLAPFIGRENAFMWEENALCSDRDVLGSKYSDVLDDMNVNKKCVDKIGGSEDKNEKYVDKVGGYEDKDVSKGYVDKIDNVSDNTQSCFNIRNYFNAKGSCFSIENYSSIEEYSDNLDISDNRGTQGSKDVKWSEISIRHSRSSLLDEKLVIQLNYYGSTGVLFNTAADAIVRGDVEVEYNGLYTEFDPDLTDHIPELCISYDITSPI